MGEMADREEEILSMSSVVLYNFKNDCIESFTGAGVMYLSEKYRTEHYKSLEDLSKEELISIIEKEFI